MLTWRTDEEFCQYVKLGRIALRPGMRLTHQQMALLGMHTQETSSTFRHGAPGSQSSQDAATAERALTAASTALQRQSDLKAAACAGGDPVQRIAQKLDAAITRSGVFRRLQDQAAQYVFENARLSPTHSVAARITQQQLPTVTAANEDPDDIGSRFTRRIKEQFQKAEVPLQPGPTAQERDTVSLQLAALRESVDRLVVLVEHLAAGETTVNAAVRSHLAAVAQKHAARRLHGVA